MSIDLEKLPEVIVEIRSAKTGHYHGHPVDLMKRKEIFDSEKKADKKYSHSQNWPENYTFSDWLKDHVYETEFMREFNNFLLDSTLEHIMQTEGQRPGEFVLMGPAPLEYRVIVKGSFVEKPDESQYFDETPDSIQDLKKALDKEGFDSSYRNRKGKLYITTNAREEVDKSQSFFSYAGSKNSKQRKAEVVIAEFYDNYHMTSGGIGKITWRIYPNDYSFKS